MRSTVLFLAMCFLVSPAVHAQSWPSLSRTAVGYPNGSKDAALLIAVEDYAFVPDIPGAVKNINDWHAWLTGHHGVPVSRVRLLRNEQATAEEIRFQAAEVAKLAPKGGTVWLVFIGHGAPAQDRKDGILVGVDAQQTARGLFGRSLPQQELVGLLGKGEQARTLFIVDACFSGKDGSGNPLAAGLQPLLVINQRKAPPRIGSKTQVLSAGRANQFAGPLPKGNRPAFSYLVLGAMRGWGDADGDRAVTASEAVDYAGKVMRTLVTGRTQEPQLSGVATDQPLATGVREQGPDLAALARAPAAIPNTPLRARRPPPSRGSSVVRTVAALGGAAFALAGYIGPVAGGAGSKGPVWIPFVGPFLSLEDNDLAGLTVFGGVAQIVGTAAFIWGISGDGDDTAGQQGPAGRRFTVLPWMNGEGSAGLLFALQR